MNDGDDTTMEAVRAWADEVIEALQLSGVPLDVEAVLGVAGVAARTAVRPAAPVTTYLVGYATGLAAAHSSSTDADGGPAAVFAAAVQAVRALAAERTDGEA
jgi:hypothetical protein